MLKPRAGRGNSGRLGAPRMNHRHVPTCPSGCSLLPHRPRRDSRTGAPSTAHAGRGGGSGAAKGAVGPGAADLGDRRCGSAGADGRGAGGGDADPDRSRAGPCGGARTGTEPLGGERAGARRSCCSSATPHLPRPEPPPAGLADRWWRSSLSGWRETARRSSRPSSPGWSRASLEKRMCRDRAGWLPWWSSRRRRIRIP